MKKILVNWIVRPLKVIAYMAAATVFLAVLAVILPFLIFGSLLAFLTGAVASDVYEKNLMDI